ncbi:MAG: hypothetical protein IJI73_09115 [Kiritimatiellae bacterium]|nr:hypothetical protein [Kiritimatiellia bacterium]
MKAGIRCLFSLLATLAVVVASATASAEVLVYEGFSLQDYTVGSSLYGKKSGNASVGLDTSSGWIASTAVFVAQGNGLTLPETWTADGSKVHGTEAGRAVLMHSQAFTTSRANRGQQRLLSCSWPSSGSVYFRFLMRIPSGCLTTSYLGNWNFVVGGLGFDCLANTSVNSCTVTNGIYMGVRNREGKLEAFAYVQPKGGELTSYPLFDVDTSKTLNCVFVAKIDIGENGHDTLSLYACPLESWSDDFRWTEVINDVSLVSGQDKFSYLQMIGQYPTGNQWITLDEFIVTTTEPEAYAHGIPGAPFLGAISLTHTGEAAYSLSAEESINDADLSWIADDGEVATTNGTTAVAERGTVSWTLSGLDEDATYRISILAANDVAASENAVGTIYTGELAIGEVTNASEATGVAGAVAVSRKNSDLVPLTLHYTITGAKGAQGETWEAPAEVTIPAGEKTGYLLVKPLADLAVDEDVEVTVTLEPGNYELPAVASATLTIVNGSDPAGADILTIVNAYDNPAGGFYGSGYTAALTNDAIRIIRFANPATAAPGLREFAHTASQYNNIEATEFFTYDWMLFPAVARPSAGETVATVRYASQEQTGLTAKRSVVTYAGSWYVPTNGTYSFRMHMGYVGLFSLDGKLLLRQPGTAAVTVKDVELSAGWHSFYATFAANGSGKIGPAETCGLTFNAANLDLAESPASGHAFDSTDGYRLSTAFNALFVPSMWAKGGDVTFDCANLLGDLRMIGQLGGVGENKFKFVNLPAGRTLEFGKPVYHATTLTGWQGLSDFSFVDWTHMTVPAGVNIRFEGAAVVNSSWTQAGHGVWKGDDHGAYSLGKCAFVFTDVPNFFGTASDEVFVAPEGLRFVQAGSPEVMGNAKIKTNGVDRLFGVGIGGAPFVLSNNALPVKINPASKQYYNDFDLGDKGTVNATLPWFSGDVHHGNLLSGNIRMTGWCRRFTTYGSVNANEGVCDQRACFITLRPVAGSAPSSINSLTLSADKGTYPDSGWNYAGSGCFYLPEDASQPLSIGEVKALGAQFVADAPHHGARQGATLSACSNSTINVGTLTGSGVHLRQVRPSTSSYWSADNDERGTNIANFVFGEITTTGSRMYVFVSSNVNITVTNIVKSAAFRYDVMSNGVNEAVLDIEGTVAEGTTITATDVAMLPARVKGFTGHDITLTETEENRTYPVVFDFDQKGGIPIGGCDGSGNLVAAPATGTINLSFTGTPRKGRFGVVKFDSVAEGVSLAGWTINTNQEKYEGYRISVHKDSTGISFGTHVPLMIMVR